MPITEIQLVRLNNLISAGTASKFYSWKTWEKIRQKVLKMDHYECQLCKAEGKYRRGNIIHHVKHLKDRPDLAMSVYDPDTGERQLITVCKEHHELLHPESLENEWKPRNISQPVTKERWD